MRKVFIVLLMLLTINLAAQKNEDFFYKGIVYILINDPSLAAMNMERYFNVNLNPVLRGSFTLLIKGDTTEAANRFMNYLNINPRSTHALVGVALSTADMEVSNTVEILERALRLNDRFSPPYLCLGNEYMKKKNFPQAVRNLNRALYLNNIPEYKIILGQLQILLDNPQEAIRLLKLEADNYPDNFYYSYLTAQAYFKIGDLPTAGKYIEAALEVKPDNSDAKLLLAKYLVASSELKKAAAVLKELKFPGFNKDYAKTYSQVLLELKDSSVKNHLDEIFSQDRWDNDINVLMGRYFSWQKDKGNVQNWIDRAILSGQTIDRLKQLFPGNYRFPEYKSIPFFAVQQIKWLADDIILLAAIKNSGEKEKIYLVDAAAMTIVKTLDFNGKFQDAFLPKIDKNAAESNIIIAAKDAEDIRISLYALKIAGKNVAMKTIFDRPQFMSAVVVGFNSLGNLAYISDAAFAKVAFESPFSQVSTLGKKTPIYPAFPAVIYQYNFNTGTLEKISDPEQIRIVPIREVREYFLIADAYQYNENVREYIKTGERLDLTSTEVVRTFIAKDLSAFIIYLSDLKNAFQALVYDSKHNQVKKIDETMFLGKDQYAEIKIIDFQPQDKELLVLTKDKEKRLLHFDYESYLYTRLEKGVYDVCRDHESDMTYILTERSKKKFYTETHLEVISLNPYSRIKVDSRNDLTGILFCNRAEQLVFPTYNGELLKLDESYKLQYAGPCFDQAVAAAAPGKNKQAVFINGRLFIVE